MTTALRPDLTADYERFVIGDNFDVDGMPFRVVAGHKAEGDQRLEWFTPGGFRAMPMAGLFLPLDFMYENEHRLYPPRDGFAGGEMLRHRLGLAVRRGWEYAAAQTTVERQRVVSS